MSKIVEIIKTMKARWEIAGNANHRGQMCPFLLTCSFADKPANGLKLLQLNLPEDIREFWSISRSAALFKDQQFGQWGVQIFTPEQAVIETSKQLTVRSQDFKNSDLVVIDCEAGQPDYGSVKIALPLDRRSDWPVAADCVSDFFEKLLKAQGDKYWEIKNEAI